MYAEKMRHYACRPLQLTQGLDVCCCEGFRMAAHRDDAACTGAGVRKPPGKETAVRDTGGWGALWRFEREGLWDLRGLTRFLAMICGFGATEFAGLVADDGSGR
jgi:hypothetical protein